MKKLNKKKIIAMLLVVLLAIPIFAVFGNSVNAQINPDTNSVAQYWADKFSQITDNGLNMISINSVFAVLNKLIGALGMSIYTTYSSIFIGATGSITPTPDNIIFNRLAILDINFFNPNPEHSLLALTDNLVLKLYNSFNTIALAAFVICAMVVGIKIVLSSLASEKAAAKNALKYWVVGIILLFLMRLIIAAIFELNELIVWKVAEGADKVYFAGIKPEDDYISIWNFGKKMSEVVADTIGKLTLEKPGSPTDGVYGYNGLMYTYAWQSLATGDLLCSILLFVLLGQAITLMIAYAKRLMYVIILSVTAPMVVFVDTLNKVMKGSSNVLDGWFKEFVSTVFMQSFHSILMLVTMNVLAAIVNGQGTGFQTHTSSLFSGAVAIAMTSGMIKFEKVYKKIFGLSDGMVGGLQGQAAKLIVGLNAAKAGIKSVADNGTKLKNATRQRAEARNRRAELLRDRGRQNAYGALDNLSLAAQLQNDPVQKQIYMNKANEMFANASRDGYKVPDELVKRFEEIASSLKGAAPAVAASVINFKSQAGLTNRYSDIVNYGAQSSTRTSNVYNSSSTNSTSNIGNSYAGPSAGGNVSDKALLDTNKNIEKEITKLRKQLSSMDRTASSAAKTNRELAKANKDIRNANAEIVSSAVATVMGPANLAAGVGMGLGFGDNMTDALKGGYVTAALDSAAEHAGRAIGKAVNARFDAHSKTDDTY